VEAGLGHKYIMKIKIPYKNYMQTMQAIDREIENSNQPSCE